MPGLAERLFWPIAKRWIAGREIDDAIRVAQGANNRKTSAIINRLGEHTPDPQLIEAYTDEYFKLLDRMEESGVQGCISVKPSQLGLAIGPHPFEKNLSLILEKAGPMRRFVWVDMESSPFTDATLTAYRGLIGSYKELGVCLQANLRRTENDLNSLIGLEGRVRLVKGAYSENAEVAYKKKSDVNENYVRLMSNLFKQGSGFAVATHDEKMVLKAEELNKENKANFEFQMLQGIRDDLKERLAGDGYRVGDYIPYGPEWFNYSKRRLRERKRTIFLLIRSITG